MDKIQILSDTEAEISGEQQEEDALNKKISCKTFTRNATNSLFDIKFDMLDDDEHDNMESKDYETRLHQNMKDWKSVYHNAYKLLKESKQKHPVVDKSILPIAKREYLDKAENLQNFIRESIQFRQAAALFLEYDYAQFMDMLENLEDLYEHRLNWMKAYKIAENLADANRDN